MYIFAALVRLILLSCGIGVSDQSKNVNRHFDDGYSGLTNAKPLFGLTRANDCFLCAFKTNNIDSLIL